MGYLSLQKVFFPQQLGLLPALLGRLPQLQKSALAKVTGPPRGSLC